MSIRIIQKSVIVVKLHEQSSCVYDDYLLTLGHFEMFSPYLP